MWECVWLAVINGWISYNKCGNVCGWLSYKPVEMCVNYCLDQGQINLKLLYLPLTQAEWVQSKGWLYFIFTK